MSKRKRATTMIGKTVTLGIMGRCVITGIVEAKAKKDGSSWHIWGGRRDGKICLCYTMKPVAPLLPHLQNEMFGYRKKTGDFLVRVVDRFYYKGNTFDDYPD